MLETKQYRDFRDKLYDFGFKKQFPTKCHFEITYHCNLNCSHCYAKGWHSSEANELSTEEIYHLIDELYRIGILWIAFSGGEPLARKDFKEIYLYAKKKGFVLFLFTNAVLLDEEWIAFFKKYPPMFIDVSLYGITKKVYEQVTGTAETFERFMRAIALLKKSGLKFFLKNTFTKENIHQLNKMEEFAEKINIRFRSSTELMFRIDYDNSRNKHIEQKRLSPEDSARIEIAKKDRLFRKYCPFGTKEEKKKFIKENLVREERPLIDKRIFTCSIGGLSFVINPYGELYPCSSLRKFAFDLKEDTFENIWQIEIPKIKKLIKRDNTTCDTCKVRKYCFLECPGILELETKKLCGRVEWYCKKAEVLAKLIEGGDLDGEKMD